jgi:hypothetical protein
MSRINDVKALLQGLTAQELTEIKSYANAKLSLGVVADADAPQSTDLPRLIVDVIVDCTASRGIDSTSSTMLLRSAQFPPFRHKIDNKLGSFLTNAVKRNRVKLRALIYLSVELLIDNLQQMAVPVSSRAVMSHIHRIPSILDRSFPGYAESGLLYLVIREKETENVRQERSDETVPRPRRSLARKRTLLHNSRRRA